MPHSNSTTTRQRPSLRIERDYDVPPEKVWRAWTDPKALIAWFGTGEPGSVTLAEVDARMGGQFRLEFHTPDGEQHSVSGFYLHVVPPRRLQFTWAWKTLPERESLVTVLIKPDGNGSLLTLIHDHESDDTPKRV